jgi:hypothetical protein
VPLRLEELQIASLMLCSVSEIYTIV